MNELYRGDPFHSAKIELNELIRPDYEYDNRDSPVDFYEHQHQFPESQAIDANAYQKDLEADTYTTKPSGDDFQLQEVMSWVILPMIKS